MVYPAATPRGEGLPYNYQMSMLLETIQRRCPDVRFRLLPIAAGQLLPASEELMDSLAFIADALPPADVLRLADMGRPVIVPATTRPIDHAHVYSVMLDVEHVMRDMLIRFKEAGHKQVGLMAYADHMPGMFRTIHGSLFHSPARCIQLTHPDPTEPTACVYDPIALAFTEHKSCTAWLAVDEFITNRLVRECINHHLHIPENISLASLFYSNKHFNIATVPIACVDVFEHAQRLGEQVGDIVAHLLNGKASRRHQYALDPAIQWGQSIGAPPKTIST
jgi:DNA-binding LacI/PurR family transcriptional regulator